MTKTKLGPSTILFPYPTVLVGAMVNGKMASLDTKLKNGDIVEILTKEKSKPSRKWLNSAKTTLAKRHIRGALNH